MELEFKYAIADINAGLALLSAPELASDGDDYIRALSSRYYDTPDGGLSRRGYTLRLRREGEALILCAKWGDTRREGGESLRNEVELPVSGLEDGLPALIGAGLPEDFAELLRGELRLTAAADFTRRTRLIRRGDFSCELALDEGVFAGREPFAELELELKTGKAEAFRGFCAALAARYGLVPQPRSKLARALAAQASAQDGK